MPAKFAKLILGLLYALAQFFTLEIPQAEDLGQNRTRPGFLELFISGVIFRLFLISGVSGVLVTVNGHPNRPLAGIEPPESGERRRNTGRAVGEPVFLRRKPDSGGIVQASSTLRLGFRSLR